MNDRLPYEEQLSNQWNDLLLPDENLAWADMKRRLEEKDDNRRLIPFWLRGCLGWAIIGLLTLAIGWWIMKPGKWFTKKSTAESQKTGGDKKEDLKKDTIS